MDFKPDFGCALDAFGVDATVTVPGGTAVETRAVWLPPVTVEVPAGEAFRRVEARRVLALPRSDVPALPRGTLIEAPLEEGGTVLAWLADEVNRVYDDHYRTTVVEGVLPT